MTENKDFNETKDPNPASFQPPPLPTGTNIPIYDVIQSIIRYLHHSHRSLTYLSQSDLDKSISLENHHQRLLSLESRTNNLEKLSQTQQSTTSDPHLHQQQQPFSPPYYPGKLYPLPSQSNCTFQLPTEAYTTMPLHKPIPSLSSFISLARSQKLGNTLRIFTPSELSSSLYTGYLFPLIIGRRNHDDNPLVTYCSYGQVHSPSDYYPYYQELPTSTRLFQGHLYYDPDANYLTLEYDAAFTQLPLRHARHSFTKVQGIMATETLHRFLRDDEYDMLMEVFNTYSYPTIEFTKFSKPCGILHKQLAFWEVRNY